MAVIREEEGMEEGEDYFDDMGNEFNPESG
jgi:hypothetical protein